MLSPLETVALDWMLKHPEYHGEFDDLDAALAREYAVGDGRTNPFLLCPDLDAFLKVVSGRPDRSAIRLRTITWNNAPEVITLKLDRHYWPTYEVRRTVNGWERRDLE